MPTKEQYGYLVGGLWIAFLITYPFVYVRKTRIVVQDGWLRVHDLAWREQSIATNAVAGIRRDKNNYWEVYSLSGEKVREPR